MTAAAERGKEGEMLTGYSKGSEKSGWECPRCRLEVSGFPALSRSDNETYICSDCGREEGLTAFTIHSLYGRKPTTEEYAVVLRKIWSLE